MALQLGALRDALMHPGDEARANKAAEEIAAYDSRFTSIDVKMEKLDASMTLMKWQLGVLIGGVATPIIKAFA